MTAIQNLYESQLRKVANVTGNIVTHWYQSGDVTGASLQQLLKAYSQLLRPWADKVAWRMLTEIDAKSMQTWRVLGNEISARLKYDLQHTPVGHRMRQLLHDQVEQVTTIPLKAAKRLERLTLASLTGGPRAKELAEEIMASATVAKSDATRLARTSVSAAATALVQARAEYIGSEGYIWETVRDLDVRSSHKKMQGKFIRWNDPPTLDNYTAHAGQFAHCRCWPRPVITLE